MKRQIESTVQCNPSHVDFADLPMFGEVVLRLKCHANEPPGLFLMGERGHWNEFAMVKEHPDIYYVALKLAPGNYFYQFTVGGVPTPDPTNPGPLTVGKGRLANVLRVPDKSRRLTFSNLGTTDIRAKLHASPPIVTFAPDEILVPAGGTANVTVSPVTEGLLPVAQQVLVKLGDIRTSKTLCQCSMSLHATTTVPSLNLCTELNAGRDGFGLEIKLRGQGTITCHVVDRLTPRLLRIRLSCAQQVGFMGTTYKCERFRTDVAKALSEMPCLLVLTDSPFVEERLWQVHTDEHGAVIQGHRS